MLAVALEPVDAVTDVIIETHVILAVDKPSDRSEESAESKWCDQQIKGLESSPLCTKIARRQCVCITVTVKRRPDYAQSRPLSRTTAGAVKQK